MGDPGRSRVTAMICGMNGSWISMFVVGYSGNMGRVHEFDRLMPQSISCCSQTSIRFLFVGAGARKNDLRDLAEDLDLGERSSSSPSSRSHACARA